MISAIPVDVQQRVAISISEASRDRDRLILCHTPSLLDPVDNGLLGTFDQVYEGIDAKKAITLILPRPGLIQNLVKKYECQDCRFEVVFYVNASAGPLEACIHLLLKAGLWYFNIVHARKGIGFRKGVLGPFETVTYRIEVSSKPVDSFSLQWSFCQKYQDELLVPKVILAEQTIQEIVNEQGSKLDLKSVDRNSCVDFDVSKNSQSANSL